MVINILICQINFVFKCFLFAHVMVLLIIMLLIVMIGNN